mgnify:CR=1 FL=1
MTPFDTALKADLQTLQHTVEYEGQNFRERDADGNTLLHCAVRSGSLAKVAYLTDFLALDPLRRTFRASRPWTWLCKTALMKLLRTLQIRQALIPRESFTTLYGAAFTRIRRGSAWARTITWSTRRSAFSRVFRFPSPAI